MRLPTSLMTGVLLVCAVGARAQTTKGGKIDPAWLSADAASKTADFKLVAGLTDANGGMNFNGFNQGGLVLTVPQGWNVVLHFKNEDPNLPHSVEIIAEAPVVPSGRVHGDEQPLHRKRLHADNDTGGRIPGRKELRTGLPDGCEVAR